LRAHHAGRPSFVEIDSERFRQGLFGEENVPKGIAHQFLEFIFRSIIHKNHIGSDSFRVFDRGENSRIHDELPFLGD
jgi:hypothetical protein